MKLADSNQLKVKGEWRIEVPGLGVKASFTVVEGLFFDCVLGLDILRERLQAQIDLEAGTLKFNEREVELYSPGDRVEGLFAITDDGLLSEVEEETASEPDKVFADWAESQEFEEGEEECSSALRALLKEFRDSFACDQDQGAMADVPPVRLEVADSAPIAVRHRRFSPLEVDIIEDKVRSMREAGQLRKSKSPWRSRVTLVKKKCGRFRFCVDFRALNSLIQPDGYPLPIMSEMVERASGGEFISTLDLKDGFFQIPLHPESSEFTAFSTPSGHYEFTCLPQGINVSPAAFQRVMDSIFGP